MVNRIGDGGGSLAREAILAAMKTQARRAEEVRDSLDLVTGSSRETNEVSDFADALGEKIERIDEQVKGIDELPRGLLSGGIGDFHEVAVQIKKAEFTFRFAMEIRNKLVDAYREVMRMNV